MKKEYIFRVVLTAAVVILVYQFGVKPVLSRDYYIQGIKSNTWAKSGLSREEGKYDVIVAGEEPEGIACAVSAARVGAKTLLISEGEDLGGSVADSLNVTMGACLGAKRELLNRGIFLELYTKLGESFSVDGYKKAVTRLVTDEKNLDVVYNAHISSPLLYRNEITGVNTVINGTPRTFAGKRVIDATRDGTLLTKCNVPYFTGSEDINMKKCFMPARLNFEIEGIDWRAVKNGFLSNGGKIDSTVKEYETSHVNMRINGFGAVYQGENRAVVKGLEVAKLNLSDADEVSRAYGDAVDEAGEFVRFLNKRLDIFKTAKLSKPAKSFVIREKTHFVGERLLSVSDILENTDFSDRIAIGSWPVDAGKLVDGFSGYIVGKPVQYAVPLECIIPKGVENLLMVGNKISFSSLASSSAGVMSVGINIGEAAGVVAVYSIIKGLTPREILGKKGSDGFADLERLLKRQGLYLPAFKIENRNTGNWSYPAARQLLNLGLIAGGTRNDYGFDREATQEDFALLLLNGVYRLSPESYSLETDGRLRRYFKSDKLTRDKTAEILTALYGVKIDEAGAYDRACMLGYIDSEMQKRLGNLPDNKALTMDEVYHIAACNIKMFTGKDISFQESPGG